MSIFLKYPVAFVGITQYYSSRHRGMDLGWWDTPDPPVYAAGEGVVAACGTDVATGAIFAVVRHEEAVEGKSVFTLYWHLRSLNVIAGQRVALGDRIGVMGQTGIATGVHLHYEVWITPRDYGPWRLSDGSSYSVDPIGITYLFPDQGQSVDNRGVLPMPEGVNPATGHKEEPAPAPAPEPEPAPAASGSRPGQAASLSHAPLYGASTSSRPAGFVSGTYYAWDGEIIENRIRITNLPERVGVAGQVTGWVEAALFPREGARKTVTVRRGDSLWSIAVRAGLSLEEVIRLNPQIADPGLIYAGDTIFLS